MTTIYTYDIKNFYTSVPHSLILEAFDHYNPDNLYTPIVAALLPLNYITDGSKYYTLGATGIPTGLAPELARMTTAYLLLTYNAPPQCALIIYFDDLASNFPLPLDLIASYVMERGQDNVTQDVLYDSTNNMFTQISQVHKEPCPLHIASNLLSRNMLTSTWKAGALRSAMISTEPHIALNNHYLRYMPQYMRAGYSLSVLTYAIADLLYFPRNNPKKPQPETTGFFNNYSQTRPTKRQLAPITKQDIHLVPIIPALPLISTLQFSFPQRKLEHRVTICRDRCKICLAYDQRFAILTPIPLEPCAQLRCVILLHHSYIPDQIYIGQTRATRRVAQTTA